VDPKGMLKEKFTWESGGNITNYEWDLHPVREGEEKKP
jgi:hypothetical protein